MIWPFNRKEDPPPKDPRTPIANTIEDMVAGGWSIDAILLAVRTSELHAVRMVRAYGLDMQQASVISSKVSVPDSDRQRKKWRKQKRDQRKKSKANRRLNVVAMSANMSADKNGKERA